MQSKQKHGGLRLFGAARTKKLMVVALGAVAAFGLAESASAQQTGYIRIVSSKGPLDGSSKDPAYKGWSAIQNAVDVPTPQEVARESSAPSVSEVVTAREQGSGLATGKVVTPREPSSGLPTGRTATPQSVQSPHDLATGQASGKRMHKPVTITKEVDSASPLLRQMQTSGGVLPEVDLAMGTTKYKLSDVMVSSMQSAAGGAGAGKAAIETISFTFQKIEITK